MTTTNDKASRARQQAPSVGDTTDHHEAEAQYATLDDFLSK